MKVERLRIEDAITAASIPRTQRLGGELLYERIMTILAAQGIHYISPQEVRELATHLQRGQNNSTPRSPRVRRTPQKTNRRQRRQR